MKPFVLFISFGLIASTGRVVNFDSSQVGKMPSGWTAVEGHDGPPPQWAILKDVSAPTQPYVFAQIAQDATTGRNPIAIMDALTVRDGDISVRVKPLSGKGDQAGGVVFRYRDPNNFYLARANAVQNNVVLYKVEGGKRIPLNAGARHDIPSNAWSILKVSIRGNRFQVYLNHRRILEAVDGTFTNPGKVGLWTVGGTTTYFDDFRVYPK